MEIKISCVYIINNLVNGKYYIGATKDFKKRIQYHKRDLRKNKHTNDYLQKSWNKYGENNFSFSILEEWNENVMYSMENWWCNMLLAHNKNYGYNIQPTNETGNPGLSEESKLKISASKKNKKRKPLTQEHKDKIGNFHKNKIVSKETRDKISKANKGKIMPLKTRVAILKANTGRLSIFKDKKKGKQSEEHILKRISNIKILQYDLQGNFIKEWKSISETRNENFDPSSVAKVCKGKLQKHKNFIWKYKNNSDKRNMKKLQQELKKKDYKI